MVARPCLVLLFAGWFRLVAAVCQQGPGNVTGARLDVLITLPIVTVPFPQGFSLHQDFRREKARRSMAGCVAVERMCVGQSVEAASC